MKFSNIGLALGLAATVMGVSAHADEQRRDSKDRRHAESGLRAVSVAPKVGEPGHGWRYFSEARKARAVVISPNGDYYFSQGEGLKLVFKSEASA